MTEFMSPTGASASQRLRAGTCLTETTAAFIFGEIDSRNRFQSVRIRDVAEHAGVSVTTVSRVLNGSDTVAEARKQRVLDAIAELNYSPSRLASNLRRRQRPRMIVDLVLDIENPHFAELVRAI